MGPDEPEVRRLVVRRTLLASGVLAVVCITGFVAYLLGPEGRFFCGSLLFMDGGTDAHFRADDWPTVWTP